MAELRGEVTVLAISHGSGVLGVADRVYRVEGGRAVEIVDGGRGQTAASGAA